MKILALNSSPRTGGQSKTEMMLNYLIEGMRDAGAEVEVVNLHEKKIKNCIGCFTCWSKTPGVCIHRDDMTRALLPKWYSSDLVIYASPLYHYMLNARMKAFIERLLPTVEPYAEEREGYLTHPKRLPTPDAVVLSVAGLPDISIFDSLSHYVNLIFGSHYKLLAEIYRPAAEMLPRIEDKKTDVFDATIKAGRELVNSRRIATDTLNRIQQPIIDSSTFVQDTNDFWNAVLQKLHKQPDKGSVTEKAKNKSSHLIENFSLLGK